jgi:hypothetical protein
MNKGICGVAAAQVLNKQAVDVVANYPHYNDKDNGYLMTPFDSAVLTEHKKGADVLDLLQVTPRYTAVIKDTPFKIINPCNTGSSGTGSSGSGGGIVGNQSGQTNQDS